MKKYALLLFLFLVAVLLRYSSVTEQNYYEADGYYWHMLSEQPLAVKFGVAPNMLRVPPTGVYEQLNFHSVVTTGLPITVLRFYHLALLVVLGLVLYRIGGLILFAVVLLAPIVVARTFIGWNDTDIYALIFTTLATWAMKKKQHTEAGLWVFFLSLFWAGWVIVGAVVGLGVVFSNWKNWIRYGIGIAFACVLHFGQVLDVFQLASPSSWPSGFLTTAELTTPSFSKVCFLLNPVSTWLIIAGVLIAAYRREHFLYTASISVLLLMLVKGERFLLIATPIWSITALVGLADLKWVRKLTNVMVLSCAIGLTTSGLIMADAEGYLLIADKVWKDSCLYLKDNTPKNSVIVSWWSCGHIVTDLAERQVFMDGGTQHLKRIFWLARALVTPSLRESTTIIRYITYFGDEEVNKKIDARENYTQILQYMENKVVSVVNPRPIYLLIYKEMLLNYPSYVKMAEWFVRDYPEHRLTSIYDTIYLRLFVGELDNQVRSTYTSNDGKNEVSIWLV